jgi:signal transduction histidine kinase
MEPNFDLDINNYTTNDLLDFFRLDKNYTLDDLKERETNIINEVTKANSKYATKYKFDIINFIKSAKENLISIKHELETTSEINKNIKKRCHLFYIKVEMIQLEE